MNYTLKITYEGGNELVLRDLTIQKGLLRIKQAYFFGLPIAEILLTVEPVKQTSLALEEKR